MPETNDFLTPEQYEHILLDIDDLAANPGEDRDQAFSRIIQLARRQILTDRPPSSRPPIPDDPRERLLWKLTHTVDEAPQFEPESIAAKASAMAALWQARAMQEVAEAMHQIASEARQICKLMERARHAENAQIFERVESINHIAELQERMESLPPIAWTGPPHPFRHAKGNAGGLCAVCNGGPKHEIHQEQP